MSWTCMFCAKNVKDSNEPDFLLRIGDLEIIACDLCGERVHDAVVAILKHAMPPVESSASPQPDGQEVCAGCGVQRYLHSAYGTCPPFEDASKVFAAKIVKSSASPQVSKEPSLAELIATRRY